MLPLRECGPLGIGVPPLADRCPPFWLSVVPAAGGSGEPVDWIGVAMAEDGLLEALDPVVPGGPRDQADEAFVGGVEMLVSAGGWATEWLIEEWVAHRDRG